VRTYTVQITSNQFYAAPGLTDSQTFSTASSAFSLTADGSTFTTTQPFTGSTNSSSFFPWKFAIQTDYFALPSFYFKGPYNIVFSTSGLDTSQFGILKLLYDFGDGTSYVNDFPIGNSLKGVALIQQPGSTTINHTYYPLALSGTTYVPSITVINGNLVNFVYSFSATFYPSSIYDIKDVHLLNSLSVGTSSNQLLNIYETRTPNYITHALALSA